jgi:hypothetical protein
MTTEKARRPAPLRAATKGVPPPRQRIPLPPLPTVQRPSHSTSPGRAGRRRETSGLSAEESDLLVGATRDRAPGTGPTEEWGDEPRPADTGVTTSAERSGTIGASVINDLVDEIERDLGNGTERRAPIPARPEYRRAVGCAAPGASTPSGPGTPASNRR